MQSKKTGSYNRNIDRWTHDSNNPRDITDDNIDDRIDKFSNVINTSRTYKIPLRYFCDLGKISFPVRINFKIRCNLEIDIKNLFEINKKNNSHRRVRRVNNFPKSCIYSVQTISLAKNFKKYLETISISTKMLRRSI